MAVMVLIAALCASYILNLPITSANPPGYLGCFKDRPKRVFRHRAGVFATRALCIESCKKKLFPYAGIQYGGECWCGPSYNKYGKSNKCNMNCKSDTGCGGYFANAVYRVFKSPSDYMGCFQDRPKRAFKHRIGPISSRISCVETCRQKSYPYAGIQNGGECWCGYSYNKYGKSNKCNKNCKNDIGCGGYFANAVYRAAHDQPGYMGCFQDRPKRAFKHRAGVFETRASCIAMCKKKKYPYAGIQYGGECWCGPSYNEYGKSNKCTMNCKQDTGCGGYFANAVYRVPLDPPGYIGCFQDRRKRAIPHLAGTYIKTRALCIAMCKKKKYPYAGIQFGGACWCGHSYNKYGKSNKCNMNCKMDTGCGGYLANAVYRVPLDPPGYIGCFQDRRKRAIPHLAGTYIKTRALCIAMCKKKKYPYAGIQFGGACWCGPSYNEYGKSTKCTMNCKQDIGCGGFFANAVYKV